MAEETRFLDMFGCCTPLKEMCGGLEKAKVQNVVISREKRIMDMTVSFAAPGAPSDITTLEWRIAAEYGLRSVHIAAKTPAAPAVKKPEPPKKEVKSAAKKPEPGAALFGKMPKDNHKTDISALTLQSGTVRAGFSVFNTAREVRELVRALSC